MTQLDEIRARDAADWVEPFAIEPNSVWNDRRVLLSLVAELQKDVDRYRWLKSLENHNVRLSECIGSKEQLVFVYMATKVDHAIDLLMRPDAALKQGGGL